MLAWADAYHRRKGRWPSTVSGKVAESPETTWSAIDKALRYGLRGCRPGSSLPLFLHRHRGRPLPRPWPRPPLTIRQILAWADEHHRRTGRWPTVYTRGPVEGNRYETWMGLHVALYVGVRGLPGGDTLPKVLYRYRGVRRTIYRPRLTIKQVLAWADRHYAIHQRWPNQVSGPIEAPRGETWAAMHLALRKANRGLPAGYSLATLLQKFRGALCKRDLPPFTVRRILAWADAYHRREGKWPAKDSGSIPEASGASWDRVDGALTKGQRGLPGGDSLSRLLMRSGRRPYKEYVRRSIRREPLTIKQILAWADAFHRRAGRWPTATSGAIQGKSR